MAPPLEQISRGVSVREAAELNDVSQTLIRRLVRDGTLPSYKLGALRRIPLSALETLQRGGNVEAAVEAIVATAPKLTDDQRSRISTLLRVGGAVT
jgi:excisionase family DNA binding protein